VVIPPPQYIVAPAEQPNLTFFYTVETGNMGGPATSSFQITEASTGKSVLAGSVSVTLVANSTNILSFSAQVPDTDGYAGLESVAYTTTIGSLTAHGSAHIWVVGNSADGLRDGSRPSFKPGVAGVGVQTRNFLPCVGCFGAPAGSLVLPPAYYLIAPETQPGLIFYATVKAGDVAGRGPLLFR
jgi:hypothetical protein